MDSILKGTTPVGPTDTVRFVTNDFMYTGGDGYTAFALGTDVQFKGDLLLDVAIDYVGAHSPVAPAVEGRIVGPRDLARGGRLNGPASPFATRAWSSKAHFPGHSPPRQERNMKTKANEAPLRGEAAWRAEKLRDRPEQREGVRQGAGRARCA